MELIWFPIALVLLFLPVNILIKSMILISTVLSPVLSLKSLQAKSSKWNFLFHTWSCFFQPLLRIEMATMGFISLLPADIIGTWALAIYMSLLLVVTWIMKKWFEVTLKTAPIITDCV
jgi:hypothetical protein